MMAGSIGGPTIEPIVEPIVQPIVESIVEPIIWLAPVAALLLTVIMVWPLRRYLLARELVDLPDARRSHARPTPRGGGLAMAVGLGVSMLLLSVHFPQAWAWLLMAIALTVLGWLDDRHDLRVRWRLAAQLLIAALVVWWWGAPSAVHLGNLAIEAGWLWTALAVIALIWMINLHNFMDGSDGLAAGQGAWCGLAFGLAFALEQAWFGASVAWCLAGACFGFLFWNRPPARVFMGDSGSLLVGGVIAGLALHGATSGAFSIWISLIVCAVFVVDATATLLHRMRKGEQWYTPHRSHAYQRLIASGWTHAQVLILYGLVNMLIICPIFLIGLAFREHDFWLALVVVGLMLAGWHRVQSNNPGEQGHQND